MAKAKRINPVFRYFAPFGLRQLADVLMVVSSVLVIIGLAVSAQTVTTFGLVLYAIASLIAVYRCVRVMTSGVNKKSPEFKSAFANFWIMLVILALSIFAILASVFWYYG